MDIDIKTVVIVLVVLFVLYTVCGKNEKFDPEFDPNSYLVTKCVYPETCSRKMYEPKFGPKKFVTIKKPFCLNGEEKAKREKLLAYNSPYERQYSTWHHIGEHEPRNIGFSHRYHDTKVKQYIPGWPNVTDDWENIRVMDPGMVENPDENPILVKSDKIPVDDMLY